MASLMRLLDLSFFCALNIVIGLTMSTMDVDTAPAPSAATETAGQKISVHPVSVLK